MDTVFIKQLKVDAIIGIHDWERRVRQTLVLDLALGADAAAVATADDISAAVDYQAVCEHVARFVQAGEFRLLETLAQRLADELLATFNPPWLRLSVAKPGAVPAAEAVGVTVERRVSP